MSSAPDGDRTIFQLLYLKTGICFCRNISTVYAYLWGVEITYILKVNLIWGQTKLKNYTLLVQ